MTFISETYAQTTTAQQGTAELLNTLLMFGLIFLVFYFLIIRPQQKKMKQHREMVSAIRRGDRVVTGGGIIGLVTRIMSEQEIMLEITDNVRIRVVRDTIASVIAKTEPISNQVSTKVEEEEAANPTAPRDKAVKWKSAISSLKKLLGSRDK